MGGTPDELRQETDATRTHLAETADRLADKVSPPRMARRRVDAARRQFGTAKDKVMGTARSSTSQAGGTAREGARQLGSKAQGNPVAAGLIAFGAGMLAGAMVPATHAEERVGEELRAHSDELIQPVRETAQEAAQQVKEEMREPAQEAAQSVKETARESGRRTTEETRRQTGNG